MSAPRKWRNRSRPHQMRVPVDYLAIAKWFLDLVDAEDPEVAELIKRRALDK